MGEILAVESIPVPPDRPVTDAAAYLSIFAKEPPVSRIVVPRRNSGGLAPPETSEVHFTKNAVADMYHLWVMISPMELAGIPSGDEASWVGASWNDRRWY